MKQEIAHSKILIIEDDFIGRTTLTQIFKKHGFKDIAEAENGKEGLQKLQSFKPDLIVCDIQMPEMDGFEFCQHVRADKDPSISCLPILVQTALTESKEKAKIFGVGASDYIGKPVDHQELVARTLVHLERELMTRKLREFNTRVSLELETAKSTQRVLIPAPDVIKETEQSYRLRIREHLQTCSELGGDFWSMKPLSDHELAVFTVDFSGHGVNAALNVFRLHALLHGAHSGAGRPGDYMTHLNATLKPLLPTGTFATMFYGVINTERNVLSYASAAAPAPIIFRKDGQEILDSAGMLLGAWKDAAYETKETPFKPDDCLLLYSDALIETPDAAGNMMAIEKAAEIFAAKLSGNAPYDPAFDALLGNFNDHYAPRLNDDLTLIAFGRV